MKKTIFTVCCLTVLFVLFSPLGWMELFSPDETRYAEIAREMIERSDFVTPTLNGVRYFEKPVLGYWWQAFSMMLFGENAFAVRLPSALSALFSALCIYLLARRFSGGWREGMLSGMIFLLTPIVFGLAGLATLDGMLAFFLTLGMTFFYFAVREKRKLREAAYLFLCGCAFGGAFLCKGFLAFAIGALAVGGYLAWTGRWKKFLTLPWIPLSGVLCVTLPWGIAIHRAQPVFWDYFFWEEHIRRFFGGAETAQHHEPFWFFAPILCAGLGYFLLILPSACAGLGKTLFRKDFYRFCAMWFLLPFLFFSASSGKLPTYILPCFAPLALLIGAGLRRRLAIQRRFALFNAGAMILCVALPVAGAGLFALCAWGVPWSPFQKNEMWKCLLILLAGFSGSAVLFYSVRVRDCWEKAVFFCMAFLPALFLAHAAVPDFVYSIKAPGRLLRSALPLLPREVTLLTFRYPFQSVCWEFRRSDVKMFLEPGEIQQGVELAASDAEKSGRLFKMVYSLDDTLELISQRHGRGGVLLVLPNKIYADFTGGGDPRAAARDWLATGTFALLPEFLNVRPDSEMFRSLLKAAGLIPLFQRTPLPEPAWIMTDFFPGKISRRKWLANYRRKPEELHRSLRKFNDEKKIDRNAYSAIYFE